MIETHHGGIRLLQFESLRGIDGLVHAVTTRPQNYAPHRGQGREQAVDARRRVCEVLGLDFDKLTSPQQVHGAEVIPVETGDIGCGRDGRETAVRFVDGLVCDKPGVPLISLSADCPLVVAYDPRRPAIGVVHSSWQGTVARSTEQMIRVMQQVYGSDPAMLLAAIAPSAGPCCYEVGEEVRRIAQTRLKDADAFFPRRDGRMTFDLWAANRQQLIECGIPAENIEVAGLCSICDTRFWSHRRDGADAGRTALFIALR